VSSIIQQRRDTSANWYSVNPILAQGEMGVDLTFGGFKIGDGIATWNALPYENALGIGTTDSIDSLVGTPCTGSVSNLFIRGEYQKYTVDGKYAASTVVGRTSEDGWTAHFSDSPVIEISEADGQSWQTISTYTSSDVTFEDTTGLTEAALNRLHTPYLVQPRKASTVGVVYAVDDTLVQLSGKSDGIAPGELARVQPQYSYNLSRIAGMAHATQCKRLGASFYPAMNLTVGWPGTSSEKFLPEGSSYTYIDDNGVSQTQDAVIHPVAGVYLWAANITMRQTVADFMAIKWPGRKLLYKRITWVQVAFNDYGRALGFCGAYRAQQDLLTIPGHDGTPRGIFWDVNAGLTSGTRAGASGLIAPQDFCEINASGHDWLVGPRYPHKVQDTAHHSALGNLEYAEVTGLATAYVEAYGAWEPLKIIAITRAGSTFTVTTNQPIQAPGGLVFDTEKIAAKSHYGFTLSNANTDALYAITSVTITSATTISIVATVAPTGTNYEVAYAMRTYDGVNPDGTVTVPAEVSCAGNVKAVGIHPPAIIPESVQPKIDMWLCNYRKSFSI
jgi:hypothetical protein